MTKTNDTYRLFDDGLMTAEQTMTTFQPYMGQITLPITAAFEALERLQSQSPREWAPITRRTTAGFLHDHMDSEARRIFGGRGPDILLDDTAGFLILDFFGRIKLRFKRLSPELHPYNVATGQQQAVDDQILFGRAATIVTAGYRLSQMGTFRDAHIVCWGGSRLLWSFPLPLVAVETPSIKTLSREGDLPEPTVRVKAGPQTRVGDAG